MVKHPVLWISLLLNTVLRPLEVPISTYYGKPGVSLHMLLILQSEHWEPTGNLEWGDGQSLPS